jgi:hypothetical protein
MPKRIAAISFVLLLVSICLAGKNNATSEPVMPDVTARGRALFEYDQAAWHATDAVRTTNPPAQAVGRYIARKSDAGWVVAFGHLNDTRDKFLVAYEATQGATLRDFTVKKLDPPQEDTFLYLAAAKAIDTALHDFQGQNRPYNVAVLPAPLNQLYVYVVPAQTKTGIYALGGDVRYLITPDGSTIVEKRQLHKTIIEMSPSSVPNGATPAAGYHTHVLSDVPEDTDVFYVLTREPSEPEYIATMHKKLFVISPDGTIREGKM